MPERSSKRKARRDSPVNSVDEPESSSMRTENTPCLSDKDFNELSEKIEKSVSKRIKDTEIGQREILKMIENLASKIDTLAEKPSYNAHHDPDDEDLENTYFRPGTVEPNDSRLNHGQHNIYIPCSSPISSAGDSSSSKPNSGTSSTHDRSTAPLGGEGATSMNVAATNGGLANTTRRKHKSGASLKQSSGGLGLGGGMMGKLLGYDDEDAAYFGSQSSAGGGGLDGGEQNTGGVSTPVLSHFRSQMSHLPQTSLLQQTSNLSTGSINPSLLLETLSWRMAATHDTSPSSIISTGVTGQGQTKSKQTPPFQNLSFDSPNLAGGSSTAATTSTSNGSRVNLNLQLAETLIKDAIRTASFDAGYSEVDFTNVSVDICLDSTNSVKPVQLNLTHKQPSSCDTTPVRSFAEVNGDPMLSELHLVASNKIQQDNSQGAPNSMSQTKTTKKRYPVLESSPLTNPLHIDASNFHTSTPSSSPLELPRNSSAESLKTTNLSMTSFASPSSTPGGHGAQSKSVPPTNRNRFYQFKPKDKNSTTTSVTTSTTSTMTNQNHPTSPNDQNPLNQSETSADGHVTGGLMTSLVHVPRKASSGVAMTTSTSSTSISKLRMPNIKASNSYFDDDLRYEGKESNEKDERQ